MMNSAFYDTSTLPLIPELPTKKEALQVSWAITIAGGIAFLATLLAFCFVEANFTSETTVEFAPVAGSNCTSIGKVTLVVDLTRDPVSPVYSLAVGGSGDSLAFWTSFPVLDSRVDGYTPLLNPSAPFCAASDYSLSDAPSGGRRTLVYNVRFASYDKCVSTITANPPQCTPTFGVESQGGYYGLTRLTCNITTGITLEAGSFSLSSKGTFTSRPPEAAGFPPVLLSVETEFGSVFHKPGEAPVADMTRGYVNCEPAKENSNSPFILARIAGFQLDQCSTTYLSTSSPTDLYVKVTYSSSTGIAAIAFFTDASCLTPVSQPPILTQMQNSVAFEGTLTATRFEYGVRHSAFLLPDNSMRQCKIILGIYQLLPEGAVYPSGCSYDLGNPLFLRANSCAAIPPTSKVPYPAQTKSCTRDSLVAEKYSTAAINAAVAKAFTPEYVCKPFATGDVPPYVCEKKVRQSGLSIASQSLQYFQTTVAVLVVLAPLLLSYLQRHRGSGQAPQPTRKGSAKAAHSRAETALPAVSSGKEASRPAPVSGDEIYISP